MEPYSCILPTYVTIRYLPTELWLSIFTNVDKVFQQSHYLWIYQRIFAIIDEMSPSVICNFLVVH